ncbi:MAG: hypothetical protein GY850_01035, partial [bacterium]|nr:hypothetical protein [bacterium]
MGRSKFTLGVMTTLWIVCLFSSPCSAADSLTGRLDSSSAVWDRIKDNSTNSDTGCNATAFDSWNNGVPYTVFMIETPRAENLSASVTAAKAADGKSLDTFMSLHCQWPPSGPLEDVIASDDDGAGYPHPGLFPSDGILL